MPMKILPVDSYEIEESARFEPKPVVKSRLKRLFERPFLRSSSSEKIGAAATGTEDAAGDGGGEFEPCSVALAKMVQNFMEESNEKQSSFNRNRCNCFNGNYTDSSEDEFDVDSTVVSSLDTCELLKGLVPCQTVIERNLLADTAKIVEKNKMCKRKDNACREIVTNGLMALGYDASVCKSRWDRKSSSYPAGEYEYIDVIISGERLVIDIDFRSEFEIARSTKAYRSLLQILPYIFVGKADRLEKMIIVVAEAAKQSLKKKGMPIPPWRKPEYVKAKWLSPCARSETLMACKFPREVEEVPPPDQKEIGKGGSDCEVNRLEECSEVVDPVFDFSSDGSVGDAKPKSSVDDSKPKATTVVEEWRPPETKPKSFRIGIKMVTGLASVIED